MSQCVRLGGSADLIKVYLGSPQALFADHRPSYHEADAKDGWQRLQDCLKTNGAA